MTEQIDQFLLEPLEQFFGVILEDEAVRSFGWDASSTRVFRTYDGDALPVLSDGNIPQTSLPALYVDELTAQEVEQDTTPHTVVIEIGFELRCSFSSKASHKSFSSLRTMSALLALMKAINTRANQINGLAEAIDDFDVQMAEIIPVREADGSGRVLYWDGGLNVRLRRHWTVPQA